MNDAYALIHDDAGSDPWRTAELELTISTDRGKATHYQQ